MMEDMMEGSARSPGADDDGEAFDEDLARAIANSLESEAPPAKRHRADRDMMETDSPQGFSLGDM